MPLDSSLYGEVEEGKIRLSTLFHKSFRVWFQRSCRILQSVFKSHQLKLNSRKQCCALASVEMVPCRRRYFLEFSRCTSVLNYSMCFEIMDFVRTKLTAIVTLEPASPLSGFCSTGPSGIPDIYHEHHGRCRRAAEQHSSQLGASWKQFTSC